MNEIIIRQPDDWHAHLRDKSLLEKVVGLFNIYGRVVCMGNLAEPVDNLKKIISYRNTILSSASFLPIIGVVLTKRSTLEEWVKIASLLYDRVFIKLPPTLSVELKPTRTTSS